MKNYKMLAIVSVVLVLVFLAVSMFISYGNQEAKLKNAFNQKIDERTAFYDKMWKTISQKSQIALKNDSSFYRNVNAIMSSRKDAPQVFMKWVQESNPNANYEQVSLLYQDLSRNIEAERNGFFEQEKMLQDIKKEHDNLMSLFPSGMILRMLGRTDLIYKPITSDRTDEVIKTGKDNNVNVF